MAKSDIIDHALTEPSDSLVVIEEQQPRLSRDEHAESIQNLSSDRVTQEPAGIDDGPGQTPAANRKALRTLSRKHFDNALEEIRPSSSEEGTLPELRKVRPK